MPQTFALISSTTVGSGGSSEIAFTSIPQTYTDLIIKASFRSSESGVYRGGILRFNSSTSGYSETWLGWQGSGSVTSYNTTGASYIAWIYGTASGTSGSWFGSCEIVIPSYTSSSYYKSVLINNATDDTTTGTNSMTLAKVGALWQNSSAITSITITPNTSYSFAQYSSFSLYGRKNS